jgi:D-beta-D-heptose 7-phosphate kinase / D-beta-D-heptose 1-phosphate adenosyltransferase
MSSFQTVISAFQDAHVLVVGDAILDEYLTGDCSRISLEAPVPIVRVTGTRSVLGGAANTAANVVSLGGRATIVSLVGPDEAGRVLQERAREANIQLITVSDGRPTLRKTRVVGQHQQIVRLDHEDLSRATPECEREFIARIDSCIDACDIVVVSDYAKGLISAVTGPAIIERAHRAGRQVIVDPRPQNRQCYEGCDYLTPNWREGCALLGTTEAESSSEGPHAVGARLASRLNANVLLTLGGDGMLFTSATGTEQFAVPTVAQEVYDVSGAGDTVAAAFALARAAGADHRTAVAIANKAAGVVVGKFGTATVLVAELLDELPRLMSRDELSQLGASLRRSGKRIVTINGSFDVLHAGHLYILQRAREQGDVLIVGLNSDASVAAYKGPDRPVMTERQRAELLLALRVVDYVHIFNEPNPIAFIDAIQPHVHVNGAEYGEDCVEAEVVRKHGARLHLIERLPGASTTGLLERLRS